MEKTIKPRKQRSIFRSGKLHIMTRVVSAHLSKELRKTMGKRALPLRVGDSVKLMRGSHRGRSGKVVLVNRQKGQVFIENITRKKSDGTERQIPFKASNLMIAELDKSDERRLGKTKYSAKKLKGKREGGQEEAAERAAKGKEGEEMQAIAASTAQAGSKGNAEVALSGTKHGKGKVAAGLPSKTSKEGKGKDARQENRRQKTMKKAWQQRARTKR